MHLRRLLALALTFLSFEAFGSPPETGAVPTPASVVLRTAAGNLVVHLDWANAPESCRAFVGYVRTGVYEHTFFDEIDESAIYAGKPSKAVPGLASNGNMIAKAGPVGEFKLPNIAGAVGFRRTVGSCNPDKRSNCTQFYVRLEADTKDDGNFSVFGKIQTDPAVLDAIKSKLQKPGKVALKIELPDK